MKENKYGILISLLFTILSLFGAIFFTNSWWQNFSFSILGGSLCSLIIFIFNYFIQMKRCAEDIVFGIYKINTFGFSSLFSEKENKSLEELIQVLNVIDDKSYDVYIKNHELLKGLFFFDKRKKKLLEIEREIDNLIIKIYEIESYIEVYKKEALNNTHKLYKVLDGLIDSNTLYIKALKIAKGFFSNVNSLEEVIDKNKIKKECADRFKRSL